jgi:hypothetical protein
VRTIQEAEIEAQKAVEGARIARERTLAAERIGAEHSTRKLEIERNQALEVAGISAREATEASRIAQEERVRSLEIARNRTIEEADIASREAIEAARIAQEKVIAAQRIGRRKETRGSRSTAPIDRAAKTNGAMRSNGGVARSTWRSKPNHRLVKTREVLNIDQRRSRSPTKSA